MKPSIPITDRRFKYYDSASTDVARTFARIRRERRERGQAEQAQRVVPIKRKQGNT